MLEAVQNHTPQVLIIDEIGTKEVGGHRLLHA
jgi:stage III sporulation protein SpoIIIAA